MRINWYPGHMHKARKAMAKTLGSIDILIEIVDARLPYSSQNPVIAAFRKSKTSIIVFNKSDLADPIVTEQWQQYYASKHQINTLVCDHKNPRKIRQIVALCKALFPEKNTGIKAINAMVVGIPNVGKSTIINTLAGKTIAKTGNEPAVTKQQQKIHLGHHIILHDTPGILWPKFDNTHSGYRLAMSGAIKNTAMEYDDVGLYAAEYFLTHYPLLLKNRYQIDDLPTQPLHFLKKIASKRGAIQKGNHINLHKICEVLLHEFRNGSIGKITLEKPDMIERELQQIQERQQEKSK